MKIEVYTDGSATTADKPGGWAYVMVVDNIKIAECCGHMEGASNNDAEMEAAIQGLASVLKWLGETAPRVCTLEQVAKAETFLVSDSELVLGWASGRYRFKQQDKIEKYHQLKFLVARLGVKFRHVRGHTGDEHNERCDKLANEARTGASSKRDKAEAILEGKTLIGAKKSGVICVWYKNCLKIVDLETNIVENYDRGIHGSRGSALEVREEKSR